MGDNFLESDPGNPHGYFEDLDFLEFHRQLLEKSAGSVNRLFEDSTMRVRAFDFKPHPQDIETAEKLIQQRNTQYSTWGWKDPRTCLFLPFWKKRLPNARYILAYKHPLEMSASLLRMGKNWDLSIEPEIAVHSWTFYMSETLKLIQSIPQEHSFIANTNALTSDPSALIERLQNWCSNKIEEESFSAQILPELTTETKISTKAQDAFAHYFPEAAKVFEQLQLSSMQAMRWLPDSECEESLLQDIISKPLDSRTALAVLQNAVQPTVAKRNNQLRNELRKKTTDIIQYRFAHETTLQQQVDSLAQAQDLHKEQLEAAQQSLAEHIKTSEAKKRAHQLETNRLQIQQEKLLNTLHAQIEKLTEQKRKTQEQVRLHSQAQQVLHIIGSTKQPTPYDLFGRPRPLHQSPQSLIQRWYKARALLKDWTVANNKIRAKQTWIVNLLSFLNFSDKSTAELQESHWQQIAQDISQHGHLGHICSSIAKKVYTAIQSEHYCRLPEAASVSLNFTHCELAKKFRMPASTAFKWNEQYATLLAKNLQATAPFSEWLNRLKQKDGTWICSGFHGLDHTTLEKLVSTLNLPLNPSKYLCSEELPPNAPHQQYYKYWISTLKLKKWSQVAHLGSQQESDFDWPQQAGIRNCYLIDTDGNCHLTPAVDSDGQN